MTNHVSTLTAAIAVAVMVASGHLAGAGQAPRAADGGDQYDVQLPRGIQHVTDVLPLANGDVVIAGVATADEFAESRGANRTACQPWPPSNGCADGFLLVIGRDGQVKDATLLGGNGPVSSVAVAAAPWGAFWVLVSTTSTTFGTRDADGRCNGSQPVLLRVSPRLTDYQDIICVGGGRAALSAADLAAGSDGTAWVAATDCRGTADVVGAWQPVPAGACDVYVARYRPGASRPVFATFLGGSQLDYPTAIAVAPDGDLVVTGVTSSEDFPTVRPAQPVHGGVAGHDRFDHDAFLLRVDVSGRWLEYSTFLGGEAQDGASHVAVDRDGTAFVVGTTASAGFTSREGLLATWGDARGENAFVVGVASDGALRFARVFGGSGSDEATVVSLLADGSVLVAGQTFSSDFPQSESPPVGQPSPFWNAPFVTRVGLDGASLGDSRVVWMHSSMGDHPGATSAHLEMAASDGAFGYMACNTRMWVQAENDWSFTETGRFLMKWRAAP